MGRSTLPRTLRVRIYALRLLRPRQPPTPLGARLDIAHALPELWPTCARPRHDRSNAAHGPGGRRRLLDRGPCSLVDRYSWCRPGRPGGRAGAGRAGIAIAGGISDSRAIRPDAGMAVSFFISLIHFSFRPLGSCSPKLLQRSHRRAWVRFAKVLMKL